MALSYIRKAWLIVKDYKFSKMLLGFAWDGYLFEIGWINSYKHQRPVDKMGEPLPWVTYSFIDFIRDRLDKSLTLLEFGSGNSTVFYSRLVKKVYAVEHDLTWYKQISDNLPANVVLTYVELERGGDYSKFADTLKEKADLIIVDGRDRVNCVKSSFGALSSRGIIVLDDSEREEYAEGITFLQGKGFKKLDFWGIAPGLFYKKCTSAFYRGDNCLGL